MFTASLNFEGLQAMIASKDPVCGKEIEAAKAAGAENCRFRITVKREASPGEPD